MFVMEATSGIVESGLHAGEFIFPGFLMIIATGSLVLLGLVALVVFLTVVYGIRLYNNMVENVNQIDNAKGSIDALLQKRHDLIPKIVEAVKEYMGYEAPTLKEVVELRNQVSPNEGVNQERMRKEDRISSDLKQIQIQAEDYPDLKASENFIQLQRSLNEIEEQLSAGRRFLNSAVKQYHDSIQQFPHVIIANMFNFKEREYFETREEVREDVNMKALFNEGKG